MKLHNTTLPLWCDVSTGDIRPYIPASSRRKIFSKFHDAAHPGIRATQRLIVPRIVWPGFRRDIREWTRTCIPCQKSKVCRHVKSPPGQLPVPAGRFRTVHVDIVGPLPQSRERRYLLTCIDRFSQWCEAIPMVDCTAESCVQAFLIGWVSRFGAPTTVITDRGVQFESSLWHQVMRSLNTKRDRTTAYHPQSNGMVERVHRRLKEAIKAQHDPNDWVDALPLTLLYIHATPSMDSNTSPAEMLYGESLRLPGEFSSAETLPTHTAALLAVLDHAHEPRAPPSKDICVPRDLLTATHVLIRTDSVKKGLQRPYEGPFRVLQRKDKFFTVELKGRPATISLDRLKAAHLPAQTPFSAGQEAATTFPASQAAVANSPTQAGSSQLTEDRQHTESVPFPIGTADQDAAHRTRSGRIVQPPKWYGDFDSS